MTRICGHKEEDQPTCGNEFQAWRKDQVYCEECRKKIHLKKQKEWKKRTNYKRKYKPTERVKKKKIAERHCCKCDKIIIKSSNRMLCDKCFLWANSTDW